MRISVITLFPGMFGALTHYGITGRAIQRGVLGLDLWNPRDFAQDRHRSVDDRPYGGGPGMVMQVLPLRDAIRAASNVCEGESRVIYLTPQGRRLNQRTVTELTARYEHIVLVAGRYEGIDERLIETEIDEELSIGDYVLSGGELAAMVVVDAISRLLPGSLGDAQSACNDTFEDGLLEYPQYTRPEEIEGMKVPDVLLSGNHQAIRRWRRMHALGRTWRKRPDLLEAMQLDDEQRRLLAEFILDDV